MVHGEKSGDDNNILKITFVHFFDDAGSSMTRISNIEMEVFINYGALGDLKLLY